MGRTTREGILVKYNQGDVIRVEGIKTPLLVVSRDFYNEDEQVITCPLVKQCRVSVINVKVNFEGEDMFVLCDQIKQLDINFRGSKKIGQISVKDRMEVSDILQGLFEY